MGIELQMLLWAIVLGLAQLTIAATFTTGQRGLMWGAGARDGEAPPVSPVAARFDRAFKNFLETFGFFAVAVLLLHATGKANEQTAMGAQLYFWARVVYVPAYAVGIPFLRTVVWAAAFAGIVMVMLPLF
jgi:uncharacterized MAPEG superfamily protein